jgi:IS4 transposase
MGNQKQRFGYMGPIKIVDSSTITLCLQKYGWAKHVRKKAGVKLHLRLVFVNEDFVYPEKAVITPAKPDDRKQMAALIDEEGATYVFDRDYADYHKFDLFCDADIGFTTRLRRKAIYEIVEELPVVEGSPILRDTKIILGNPQKRMKNVLRRIEATDSQGNSIVILTNRFDVTAEEMGELYRNRWQIELFFKYIKQHLKMTQFYGTTEKAVQTQIYIGLITYLLLTLIRLKCEGKKLQLLDIHQILEVLLWEPWSKMMEFIYRKPSRTSKGRQKKRE